MEENLEYTEDSSLENQADSIKQEKFLPGLDKRRKIAVIILFFLALSMMILWFIGLKERINDPFLYKGDDAEEVVEEDLSTKDTDGDGLSDSDEINIYGTSPYLEDSDSDGFSDYVEVSSGNNPNCIGTNCESSGMDNPDSEGDNLFVDTIFEEDSFSIEEAELMKKILIESGYEEDLVNSLSEDELYQGYSYLLQGGGTEVEETPAVVNNVEIDDASVIRQAFVDAGYDEVFLEQISDEELIGLYNEAMLEYESE